MIISSNTANGAVSKSAKGDRFSIILSDDFAIPDGVFNCEVSVPQAKVWFATPNVLNDGKTNINSVIIIYQGDVQQIYVPQGIYSIDGINEAIETKLENQGLPDRLITISGNEATNRVEVEFNYVGTTLFIEDGDLFNTILGFDPIDFTSTIVQQTISGQSPASLNHINSYRIHTNLVQNGLRANKNYNQTVAVVPIDVAPNSQITYEPIHPLICSADELIGTTRTKMDFWITDEENNEIEMGGEDWEFVLQVSYLVPLKSYHK